MTPADIRAKIDSSPLDPMRSGAQNIPCSDGCPWTPADRFDCPLCKRTVCYCQGSYDAAAFLCDECFDEYLGHADRVELIGTTAFGLTETIEMGGGTVWYYADFVDAEGDTGEIYCVTRRGMFAGAFYRSDDKPCVPSLGEKARRFVARVTDDYGSY